MDRWTAYIPVETKRDIEELTDQGYKIAKYLREVIVSAVNDVKSSGGIVAELKTDKSA